MGDSPWVFQGQKASVETWTTEITIAPQVTNPPQSVTLSPVNTPSLGFS